MLERWESLATAQPHRTFMIGLALGKDGIELWRFSKSGSHKRSGVFPLHWEQHDAGWQVSHKFKRVNDELLVNAVACLTVFMFLTLF